MKSNQIIGIALLVAGAACVYFGYEASQGLGEQMHETITGRFTESTTWLFVLGAVSAVAGLLVMRR